MNFSPYNSVESYLQSTPTTTGSSRLSSMLRNNETRQPYSPYSSNQYVQRYPCPESYSVYNVVYVPASIKVIKSYRSNDPFLGQVFNPNDIDFDVYDERYTYKQEKLRTAAQDIYKGKPLNFIVSRLRRWYELGEF